MFHSRPHRVNISDIDMATNLYVLPCKVSLYNFSHRKHVFSSSIENYTAVSHYIIFVRENSDWVMTIFKQLLVTNKISMNNSRFLYIKFKKIFRTGPNVHFSRTHNMCQSILIPNDINWALGILKQISHICILTYPSLNMLDISH